MLNDCVAILNISSSSVNVLIGEMGVNNTFNFRVQESVEYYAFNNREFTEIKELEKVIATIFTNIKKNSEISEISKIYVGIPGEFCKTLSKNYKITFNSLKKITKQEVKTLFDLAFEDTDCEYSLAHRSAVYYMVDAVKTDNPIGKKGVSLAGRLYFSLVENSFKEVVENILKKVGISEIYFISEDYASSQYLFSHDIKDACKILIDVGNVTTSLSISCGDGLLYSNSLSLGGGIITAYLYDKFLCDYETAELLKRQINLGLRNDHTSKYVVLTGGDALAFSRDIANDTVLSVLDSITEGINKLLSSCPLKLPNDTDTYFTGGGICYMRGAVEYVSTRLGVLPKTIAPKVPLYDKFEYSSRLSLMYVALNKCNDKIFFTVKE